MAIQTIKVPDIGGAEGVDVIEISVKVGDVIAEGDSIVVLETDKASMEIPADKAGKVVAIKVKEGDKVSQDDVLIEVEAEGAAEAAPAPAAKAPAAAPAPAKASAATSEITITVPDIGGAENVDVIEVTVKPGDEVAEGDSLIVLETDKASMEVPATASGKIVSISVNVGDKISQGTAICVVAVSGGAASAAAPAPAAATPAASASSSEVTITVPDIGGAENVDVIEVTVKAGDDVAEGDSLIVLETDKASMEVPATASGKIVSLAVKVGDKVSQGSVIGVMTTSGGAAPVQAAAPAKTETSTPAPKAEAPKAAPAASAQTETVVNTGDVYAGPAVRKLGRQLGVDLGKVSGTGPRGRLLKDDVRNYVKNIVVSVQSGASVGGGSGIPRVPAVDFAKFGEIEMVKMSKIKKLTAENMTRNWLNVPHVTQWDDVDITEMEAFRTGLKAEAEKRGSKLTPLPFLLKACAAALRAEPSFNVSMHHDGEHIVQKNYVHIGVAVDTPIGLLVPVVRDVDKKGLWELADEINVLAKKARDGKLMPAEMQGGCFTISSLGAMGGSGFTPMVNAPEVAILGVSRAQIKPVWNGKEFVPRNMLPISLSYDHRAVNGADAGRFFTFLTGVIADIRRLVL
ncbi:dihydrolipoyllysine-residue acetyltransferase [Cellvibrio sp. PSBB006]|uniref:dihydrolipoyllysine-residue acetyltransferase n=1 Tax=Cellvibrio sp. PSBB006 TaxID=1987723 RepID=UPI000B3B990D|nr:dihydrolipoyllysine-residue acetyltransferase [Cellvibrio sp. PSBB006]ARU27329.1 pyruvate dehydrogenase complex dihydrolipoyllysine-residue acetyltransferase [Cellvibrio sp. PSBB006]